jgi:RHS repeat-associated protein
MRRVVKLTYSGGVLSQTRHIFYSEGWQALEERLGAATAPERQFIWGIRSIDDLVLRDRDSTGYGALNERFYTILDANGNVTAIVNVAGTVQERYAYDAYGMPIVLTPAFVWRTMTQWDWETRYGGYRWDAESGHYQVRHRFYSPVLGCWLTRDPVESSLPGMTMNLYLYAEGRPLSLVDPQGAFAIVLVPAIGIPLLVILAVELGFDLMCAYRIGMSHLRNPKPNDLYTHCVASCQIARHCWLPVSIGAGIWKEIIDFFVGTGFSVDDMIANICGYTCAGFWAIVPIVHFFVNPASTCEGCCNNCCGYDPDDTNPNRKKWPSPGLKQLWNDLNKLLQ